MLEVIEVAPDTFRFWTPLVKAESGIDRWADERPVQGMASCEDLDAQDEVIVQKGMDFEPCLKHGVINWDHKNDPGSILGEVRHMEVAKVGEHPVLAKAGTNGLGLYVRGFLWPERVGHRGADDTWALLMAKSETGKPLGWSVEGRVLEKSGKRITKCEIRNLAITAQPVQRKSFAEIVKSMTSETAEPVRLENVAGQITSVLWGRCRNGRACYDPDTGSFHRGRSGALEHWTVCKGYAEDESVALLKHLITSRLAR